MIILLRSFQNTILYMNCQNQIVFKCLSISRSDCNAVYHSVKYFWQKPFWLHHSWRLWMNKLKHDKRTFKYYWRQVYKQGNKNNFLWFSRLHNFLNLVFLFHFRNIKRQSAFVVEALFKRFNLTYHLQLLSEEQIMSLLGNLGNQTGM